MLDPINTDPAIDKLEEKIASIPIKKFIALRAANAFKNLSCMFVLRPDS